MVNSSILERLGRSNCSIELFRSGDLEIDLVASALILPPNFPKFDFTQHEYQPPPNFTETNFQFCILRLLSLLLSLLLFWPHKRNAVLRSEGNAVAPPKECCVANRGECWGPTKRVLCREQRRVLCCVLCCEQAMWPPPTGIR